MIAVALKGLLGRKTRTILTALAIVLGTGMDSATFIFTDTLNHAFNGVFSKPYEHTSVVVSGKQIVTGAANTPSVPASLVARIKKVPGVEAASGGFLFATVKLVGQNGKAIGNGGPQFGFGVDPADKRFTPLALTSGRWPSGARGNRDRGSNRGEGTLRRRRHDRRQRKWSRPPLHHHRTGRNPRRVRRQRNTRRVRREHRTGPARQTGPLRQHLRRRQPRRHTACACSADPAAPLRDRDGADVGRGGGIREQVRDGRDRWHQVHPARVRRHCPVRRRLRHLQHDLDDGGAAHA